MGTLEAASNLVLGLDDSRDYYYILFRGTAILVNKGTATFPCTEAVHSNAYVGTRNIRSAFSTRALWLQCALVFLVVLKCLLWGSQSMCSPCSNSACSPSSPCPH